MHCSMNSACDSWQRPDLLHAAVCFARGREIGVCQVVRGLKDAAQGPLDSLKVNFKIKAESHCLEKAARFCSPGAFCSPCDLEAQT